MENGGIKRLDAKEQNEALERAGKASCNEKIAKFVPASGAASRMFKDLFARKPEVVGEFFKEIEKFAFYDSASYEGLDAEAAVEYTLGEKGLGYGSKPKAVLKFHRYPDEIRTALAEQFIEAKEYAADADGNVNLYVTISPEHEELFNKEIERLRGEYEARFGVKYSVKTMYQYKWTDTLAVTEGNEPFLLEDGSALHRPAGHGALINNLGDVEADVAVIKNIDNVSHGRFLPEIVRWKKILIGTALREREKAGEYLRALREGAGEKICLEAAQYLRDTFSIDLPCGECTPEHLISLLDRPLRVCGMVRNEGEPGGGPFIIREKDGTTSLQILEGAQIDPCNPMAQKCLSEATHFNPVDLVCCLSSADGLRYDLKEYVDPETGLISSKSYQGRTLKALELPGLWNGSMSRWNTIFVEVPVETFNPVKTVLDLLRPAHQG